MDFSFYSTALYYGLYLFGAGSIGYLLVRLSYPDVRLLDKDTKLGVSVVLGFFIMCISLAFEWVAGYAAEFGLAGHDYPGLMPLFSCVLVVLTFGIMKVYFLVNSPRMLTVGLPIHSASNAAKAMQAPESEAQKPRQAVAAQVEVAPLPSRPVATVTPQPSGLFGFVDLIFKKRVPQTGQRKQELIEIDIPFLQHVAGARPEFKQLEQKTQPVRLVDVGLPAQAGRQPSPGGQAKADANLPAPFVSGLREKEFSQAKASQKSQKTPQSSFASKAAPFVAGLPKEQPKAAGQRQAPSPSEQVPADEAGRKKYYDRKLNELLSGFPAEDTKSKDAKPAAVKPAPVPLKSRKELEAESELIIEDLVPSGSPRPVVQAAEPGELPRRRLYEQIAQEAGQQPQDSESRRRMYAQQRSIHVIAPRDVSETDEFADIISDIYSQLKSSAREDSLNDSMKVNVPPSSPALRGQIQRRRPQRAGLPTWRASCSAPKSRLPAQARGAGCSTSFQESTRSKAR